MAEDHTDPRDGEFLYPDYILLISLILNVVQAITGVLAILPRREQGFRRPLERPREEHRRSIAQLSDHLDELIGETISLDADLHNAERKIRQGTDVPPSQLPFRYDGGELRYTRVGYEGFLEIQLRVIERLGSCLRRIDRMIQIAYSVDQQLPAEFAARLHHIRQMLNGVQFESRTVEEATGRLRETIEEVRRGLLDAQKIVVARRFE